MDIQKEKEIFDAYWEKEGRNADYEHKQYAWSAWQAAKAQAVPEGFVLVPKEPTLLMQRAGCAEAIKPNLSIVSARDIYKAMIEAQEPK